MDLSQLSDDELIAELHSAMGGGAQGGGLPPGAGIQPVAPAAPDQNMVLSGVNAGGLSYKNMTAEKMQKEQDNAAALDLERKKEGMKGAQPSEAGRVTLAEEALKSIRDVKAKLFPDGTPNSFNRGLAIASNLPQLKLPGVGAITPNVRPDNPLDPTDNNKAAEAQNVSRELNTGLMGRQLIQTGVAARPDETKALHDQFAPHMTSAAKSAFDGLTQLEDFYTSFLGHGDPQGVKGFNPQEKTGVTSSGVKYKILP